MLIFRGKQNPEYFKLISYNKLPKLGKKNKNKTYSFNKKRATALICS